MRAGATRTSTDDRTKGDSQVAIRKKRPERDVEKTYPIEQFAAKLRRLADCVEQGNRFQIQVAGERVSIPPTAIISIEHERGSSEEEVEFQIRWPLVKKTPRAK
jgi:amphi-Trp domain-containing protein